MANGDTGSPVVPCPLCAYANPADAARCARCGVPTDLMQCPNCDAVNPSSTAVTCWRCHAPLGSIEPAPPRALATSISHADRIGDIVGTYVGFALFFAMVALAGYRLIGESRSGVEVVATIASSAEALDLLSSAPPVALQFPPAIELETEPVAEKTVPIAITSTPRRVLRKTQSRAHPTEHIASAETVLSQEPAVSSAPIARGGPQRVAASRPATQLYCTAAALRVDQCRPEGLITGQ